MYYKILERFINIDTYTWNLNKKKKLNFERASSQKILYNM